MSPPPSATRLPGPSALTVGRPGILIVSNRLPITIHRGFDGIEVQPSSGGLVSALDPVVRERGGTWVGWPGGDLRRDEHLPIELPYRIEPVPLTESEITNYYHGFANSALWPLLHSLTERARFDPKQWTTYERVNVRFAQHTADLVGGADFVWIHDYHLMRAPRHLRRIRPGGRIAFFLHTPFPPHDVFRILPWDKDVLRGLLACDLVGFHIADYAHNFLQCAERLLGTRVDYERMLIEDGDRTVRVGAFPLGIDFERFEQLARDAPPASPRPERIILGVDRLDYTKGIPERIRAFEHLLEEFPEYRERVTLVQIAVPTRAEVAEYQVLKREIDQLVGHVNGRFGTATWSPIRYLYQSVSQDRLASLYRDADVALITPLRDGMNLVAKEFVACQVDRPGVLIVSRLAGTAETMHEAIRVNPYDLDATVAALRRALTMDDAERCSRLAALRRRERRDNVHAWLEKFMRAVETPAGLQPPGAVDFERWLALFLKGYRLALFLEYDGTTVPYRDLPAEATMTDGVRAALAQCRERTDTDVTILTGRSMESISALVDEPHVTLVANDGLEIAGPGLDRFHHPDLRHYEKRTRALARVLDALQSEGAWIEKNGPTLTVHYGGVPRGRQSEIRERARVMIDRAGFRARAGHLAIEACPPIGFDRGQAVLHVLRARYGPAWSETVRVVYAGNEEADEDAFRLFAGLGFTFRIGSAETQTAARHRLPGVQSVETLVRWLAERPETLVPAKAAG